MPTGALAALTRPGQQTHQVRQGEGRERGHESCAGEAGRCGRASQGRLVRRLGPEVRGWGLLVSFSEEEPAQHG
jgi:hypothetical protein